MATGIGILGEISEVVKSAKLTPTEHALFQGFLSDAVDPEYATRYISQRLADRGNSSTEDILREIKRDWRHVVLKCG